MLLSQADVGVDFLQYIMESGSTPPPSGLPPVAFEPPLPKQKTKKSQAEAGEDVLITEERTVVGLRMIWNREGDAGTPSDGKKEGNKSELDWKTARWHVRDSDAHRLRNSQYRITAVRICGSVDTDELCRGYEK